MCGIFGKLYFNPHRQERKMLIECLNTLSHRGPDDTGIYEDQDIFLGSRRLSIIDLSKAGHMPMSNERGNLWIVFNGEVYNYLEIRKTLEKKYRFISNTDTEVILHLFEEKGPSCLKELRGMFAFAIWDVRKKELFLARDHLGKKPIKFYLTNHCFIFASEAKALLKDISIPKEVDPIAIHDFLTYQYVPSPRTGFKNIYKLEPAHYMIVKKNGSISKHVYWSPYFLQKSNMPEHVIEELTLSHLKEAVKIRLRSDVPLGAHLSGGVDSSLIVALMAKQSSKRIKTYSVGFKERNYNELEYARLVAKQYHTEHHEIIVNPLMIEELSEIVFSYEEPFADPSILPTWFLCKNTKKDVTVVLNGDGGDENFGGYLRYIAYRIALQLRFVPYGTVFEKLFRLIYNFTDKPIFRHAYKLFQYLSYSHDGLDLYLKLIGCFDEKEKNSLYSYSFKKQVDDLLSDTHIKNMMSGVNKFNLDELLLTDLKTYLPDDLLVKIDIAGMAHSLEVRSPFLDQKFVDFTSQIPSKFKLRGFESKYLLKKIARKYIPNKCIDREKKGFEIPIDQWINNQLRSQINKSFMDETVLFYDIFEKKQVHKLINQAQLNSDHVWTLFILKEWLNTWF